MVARRVKMASGESHNMNLSKSRFMAGLQCLKRLYLQVHEPDLAGSSMKHLWLL